MAEIRVRDAAPELMKQLQQIATELHQATITGCLEKLIPRYHDMKKRIAEQENEIGKLCQDQRAYDMRVNSMHSQFNDLEEIISYKIKDLVQLHKSVVSLQNKFGTKKKRRPAAAGSRKAKIVPSKKKRK